MSALHPHIRVLRAEAEAIHASADSLSAEGTSNTVVWLVLRSLAIAKIAAAAELENEQRELESKVAPTVKGR